MSSKENDNNEVKMELKYCEQCGGLWVRERGTGVVFCEKCQGTMDELPSRKKRPGRVKLPRAQLSAAERYGKTSDKEGTDLEAVGGVA